MNIFSTLGIFIFNILALAILSCVSIVLLALTLIQKAFIYTYKGIVKVLRLIIQVLDKAAESFFVFIYKYKISIFAPILFFFLLSLLLIYTRTPSVDVVKKIEGTSLSVYDRTGKLLYSSVEKNDNRYTNPDSFPAMFMQAVVASQDKRFFTHHGFDWQAFLTTIPFYFSVEKGTPRDTITQQVAEHFIDHNKDPFERFISKIYFSYRLEKQLSKKEILGTYLGVKQVGKVRGMQAAARYYFDRSVSDLNSHELLYLTALLNNDKDNEQVEIAKVVEGILQNLINNQYISDAESKVVRAQEVSLARRDSYKKAPLITDYIVDSMYELYGAEYIMNYGLKVYTSIDLTTQNQLQQIVSENAWRTPGDSSLSLFVLNTHSGQMLGIANSNLYNTIDQKKALIDTSISLYTGLTSNIRPPSAVLSITDENGKSLYQNTQIATSITNTLNGSTLTYGDMTAVFVGDYVIASVVHDNEEGASSVSFIQNDVLDAVKKRVLQAQVQEQKELSVKRTR